MSSSSKTLHLEPIDTIHHTKLERVTDLLTESMIDDMTDRLSYWLPQSFALCLTEWMAFTESKFQILATLLQSSIVQVFQSSGFFTSVLYIKNCWLSDFFAEQKLSFGDESCSVCSTLSLEVISELQTALSSDLTFAFLCFSPMLFPFPDNIWCFICHSRNSQSILVWWASTSHYSVVLK